MTELPLDILDHHLAIVGKVGSGKTYAAKGLVERLLDARRRVCVIDPTGAWFGLRSGADGLAPGYPVVIFGGDHGDVPITDKAGAILARLVVERVEASVIDLSAFNLSERRRLAHDFLAELHLLNRTPLHLVIDEADELAPQNPMAETKRLLHEVDRIVRRGRIKGFRVTMITQRPAVLHKNVLTQANALVAMRITSPQDRKAILDWISAFDKAAANRIGARFATLAPGQGWVWAPDHDRLDQVGFPPIKTFDSSRAPKVGDAPAEAPKLVQVDLAEIRAALAVVDEKPSPATKTSPPSIDSIATQLAAEYKRGAEDGYKEGYAAGELAMLRQVQHDAGWLVDHAKTLAEIGERWMWRPEPAAGAQLPAEPAPPPAELPNRRSTAAPPRPAARSNGAAGDLLPNARAILTVVAQRHPARWTWGQAATLAGKKARGGQFNHARRQLLDRQLVAEQGEVIGATEAGLALIGVEVGMPQSPAELLQAWAGKLEGQAPGMLSELQRRGARWTSLADLAAALGRAGHGGQWNHGLSQLKRNGLIEVSAQGLRLAEMLR